MRKNNNERQKVAVITGGSSGIGKVIIKTLNEYGYKTVCVSRIAPPEEIECDFFQCDLSVSEQAEITAKRIADKYEKIQLIINNAGLGISGATELLPMESVRYVMEVDYFAPFVFTRALLKSVPKGGKIVMVSSACALFALPYRNVYCSAKAALNMLSYGLRMELKNSGISVVTVCPGDVKSEFTANRLKFEQTNERYGNNVIESQQKIDGRQNKRMDVNKVGKKIAKIAVKKKRALYIVGAKYKLLYFCSRVFSLNFMLKVTGKIFS